MAEEDDNVPQGTVSVDNMVVELLAGGVPPFYATFVSLHDKYISLETTDFLALHCTTEDIK